VRDPIPDGVGVEVGRIGGIRQRGKGLYCVQN
jgi:hypothetical protein